MPGAGGGVLGSTNDGLVGVERLSVPGAIVGGGPTEGIGPSVGGTVDGGLVITVNVGVDVGVIVGGNSVGTEIG